MTEATPSGAAIEVTFRLPAAAGATQASVAGDFNAWSRTATPMEPTEDGLEATVRLEPGRWYRYRYWVDDDRWENDWQADWYTPNAYGGDDSVVDLTDESPRYRAAQSSTAGAAASPETDSASEPEIEPAVTSEAAPAVDADD